MKRIALIIILALTSCKSVEAPSPIKPPVKVKKVVKPKKKEEKKMEKKEEKKEEKVEVIAVKGAEEQPSNDDTLLNRIWGNFKVNRAVSLLKELKKGKVYRTDESILLVMKSDDMTDDILSELAKIYALQDGGITIYSNLNVKEKLAEKGLSEAKIAQKSRDDGNTVIRLAVVE